MLKDKWKDLQDAIEGVLGSGDDISAEHLNLIANELIKSQSDIEDNKTYKANKSDIIGEQIFYDEIDTKYYPGNKNIPLVMTYDERNIDNPNEYYENAPFSYCAIITVSQEVFYGDREEINYTSRQIAYNGYSMKVRTASADGEGTFEGVSWIDVTPTKVSQLTNDLEYTTESKVKEMIEELPPVLYGADIDTKFAINEFVPPLMFYVSALFDANGTATGKHYANAPFIGYGMIVSRSYDEYGVKNILQMALSSEGVLKTRTAYEEQNLKDVLWERDLIPKKVGDLENDKEYTTKKDVEDEISATKSEIIAESNQMYANALKGYASGNEIIINDLSPCQHTIKANLHSENLVNIEVNENSPSCDFEITDNVIKITKNSNQYSPSFYVYLGKYEDYKGKTITFSIKRLEKTGTSTTQSNDILYLMNGVFSNCRNYNYPLVTTATVSGVSDTYDHYKTITIPDGLEYEDLYFRLYAQTIVNPYEYNVYSDLMCAFGSGGKPYKPYVDVEGAKLKIYGKTTEDNVQEHTVDANGNVEGVISLYPTMNFSVGRENVIINVEYNRDINKAFEQMQQAIISLGGNV